MAVAQARHALFVRLSLAHSCTLLSIVITTGMSLLMPLILRDLIDRTIPSGDVSRLVLLAVCLLIIPGVTAAANVIQRQLNARVGEGVIYDCVWRSLHGSSACRCASSRRPRLAS